MRNFVFSIISLLGIFSSYAQIGYQVSLLNNATGEPRANERVAVTVKITDSEGKIVCEETKNETSNDFGVVSMSVGNSETFSNADWSKLPFFIEASVDGRMIGKSQLLSVPVAEHANHTGVLSKELLCSKEWIYRKIYDDGYENRISWTFLEDGTYKKGDGEEYHEGYYHIDGNSVHYSEGDHIHTLTYSSVWNCLFWSSEGYVFK